MEKIQPNRVVHHDWGGGTGEGEGEGVGKGRGWGGKGYTMSQMETPLIDQSLLSLVDCAVTPL